VQRARVIHFSIISRSYLKVECLRLRLVTALHNLWNIFMKLSSNVILLSKCAKGMRQPLCLKVKVTFEGQLFNTVSCPLYIPQFFSFEYNAIVIKTLSHSVLKAKVGSCFKILFFLNSVFRPGSTEPNNVYYKLYCYNNA